jgi:hypothetical protein
MHNLSNMNTFYISKYQGGKAQNTENSRHTVHVCRIVLYLPTQKLSRKTCENSTMMENVRFCEPNII